MRRGGPAAAIALTFIVCCALPTARAQPDQQLRLQLPPIDLTTPPDNDPQRFLNGPDHFFGNESCAPAWPCRLRLFGTLGVIDKYGGVGLKGTALFW
jgi:hypothetical protein